MPKQQTADTNPNQTAMNNLATKVKIEQAEHQYRLANYATPYGFDPEQVDFDRAGKFIEDYGSKLSSTVFAQSSPTLRERVDYCVNEIQQRQGALEALLAAGAEITVTDEQLYEHAKDRVFGGTRAGQQARMAGVQ